MKPRARARRRGDRVLFRHRRDLGQPGGYIIPGSPYDLAAAVDLDPETYDALIYGRRPKGNQPPRAGAKSADPAEPSATMQTPPKD